MGDVIIFFWDARDGASFVGWWFGPRVDFSHPGWARHDDRASQVPPTSGWMIPSVKGAIDPTLMLSYGDSSDPSNEAVSAIGILVSGCEDATVCSRIKGRYLPSGVNHGRPVYKK